MSRPRELAPRLDWRRAALGGLLALLVGVGVVLLIGRAAGFAELGRTLRGGEPAWLVVCALGQLLVFAGYAAAYRHAAAFEHGPEISTGLSLRVTMASFGLTQLVAAGGAAAMAVTYWAFRRLRFDRRSAGVRMVGLNTLVYLVFGLIGWAAALAALLTGEAPLGLALPWLIAIPLLLVGARWFTDDRRVERWTGTGGNLAARALSLGVGAAWWVRRALRAPDGQAMLPGAAAYWAGDAASLWAGVHAFGGDPAPAALVLAYTTGYVANSLPVPLVATGAMDAATVFALTAVGVPLEVALLGVVAHRVFAFWLPLAPGLVCAALLPRTGRLLERAAAAAGRDSRDVAALT